MTRILAAALLLAGALPAAADEFTDTVDSALSAYRDNDVKGAREELDYAINLLDVDEVGEPGEVPARGAAGLDPRGGRRGDAERPAWRWRCSAAAPPASATYSNGTADMTITLVADLPMVSGLGAIFSGMAAPAAASRSASSAPSSPMNEGDLQGVVDSRVMVSVSGRPPGEKQAQLEAMDFEALSDF